MPVLGEIRHADVFEEQPAEPTATQLVNKALNEGIALDDIEAELLQSAVERAKGNLSSAARMLGISRPQIAYRLKKIEHSSAEDE